MNVRRRRPGYWIVDNLVEKNLEVVYVLNGGGTFYRIGYGLELRVESENFKFIQPFHIEDI